MSKCHPRSTARPTTAIKQLDAWLNALSDDSSRWLRPAPPDGGIGTWLLAFMCRVEPQPGGAAAMRERGPEHARAGRAWSDSRSRRRQIPPPCSRARTVP